MFLYELPIVSLYCIIVLLTSFVLNKMFAIDLQKIFVTLFLTWIFSKKDEENDDDLDEASSLDVTTNVESLSVKSKSENFEPEMEESFATYNCKGKQMMKKGGRTCWFAPPLVRNPFFGSNQNIKNYPVSNELHWAFKNYTYPPIIRQNQQLCIGNYTNLFHNWLWIEEKRMSCRRKSFTDVQVLRKFKGKDCYFTFPVKNVGNFNPELNIGDYVSAYNPGIPTDPIFRGPIFYINYRAETVLIRFPSKFREFYDQVPLTVSFEFNRQSLLFCHNAIEMAVNEFPKWLFPNEKILNLKSPLISFTESKTRTKVLEDGHNTDTDEDSENELFRRSKKTPQVKKVNNELTQLNQLIDNGGIRLRIYDDMSGRKAEPLEEVLDTNLCWIHGNLQDGQKFAVKNILHAICRPLPHLLVGSKKSGKTYTLVESIAQIYLLNKTARILVTTATNEQADLLASRLQKIKGLNSLTRFISFAKRRENEPEDLNDIITNPMTYINAINSRILVTTCKTAAFFIQISRFSRIFTHVFIDDANQISEPETLIPILLGNIKGGAQILLSGDYNVFPQVFDNSGKNLMRKSLFHRLLESDLYTEALWGSGKYDHLVQELNYDFQFMNT